MIFFQQTTLYMFYNQAHFLKFSNFFYLKGQDPRCFSNKFSTCPWACASSRRYRSLKTCRTTRKTAGTRPKTQCPFIVLTFYNSHKFNVLLLTFLSYASYHMARKPTSVVKNVLRPESCNETEVAVSFFSNGSSNSSWDNGTLWCAWAPFGQLILTPQSIKVN